LRKHLSTSCNFYWQKGFIVEIEYMGTFSRKFCVLGDALKEQNQIVVEGSLWRQLKKLGYNVRTLSCCIPVTSGEGYFFYGYYALVA